MDIFYYPNPPSLLYIAINAVCQILPLIQDLNDLPLDLKKQIALHLTVKQVSNIFPNLTSKNQRSSKILYIENELKRTRLYLDFVKIIKRPQFVLTLKDHISSFKFLRQLCLRSCNVKTVGIFTELPCLECLDLSENNIENANGLADNLSIVSLDLSNNKLRNIPLFHKNSRLQCLYISNNNIVSLCPLAEIFSLGRLQCNHNKITSLDCLLNLINLKHLSARNNFITCLNQFPTGLKWLDLSENKLKNIKFNHLPYLLCLILDRTNCRSISFIQNTPHLEKLSIVCNRILCLGPLSNIKNLSWLNASQNKITCASALSNLPNLRYINLSVNEIHHSPNIKGSVELTYNKLKTYTGIPGITYLNLAACKLRTLNLSSVGFGLVHLILSSNYITNIEFLTYVPGLVRLDLSNNLLVDIYNLINLKNLQELNLSFNTGIRDFTPIFNLKNLVYLSLQNCYIPKTLDLKEILKHVHIDL